MEPLINEYLQKYLELISLRVKLILNKNADNNLLQNVTNQLNEIDKKFQASKFTIIIPKRVEIIKLLTLLQEEKNTSERKKLLIILNGIYKFLKVKLNDIVKLNIYANVLLDEKSRNEVKEVIEQWQVKEKKKIKQIERKEIAQALERLYFILNSNEILSNKYQDNIFYSIKESVYVITKEQLEELLKLEEQINKKLAEIQEQIALHNIGMQNEDQFNKLQKEYLEMTQNKEKLINSFKLLELS
ncbi:MAG: hypothetical protein QXJ06_00835 [Candidatus Aenigmatarchaeota archaeon]